MTSKLLSRKFLLALGAIATLLTSHEMDWKTKGLVAGLAFAYLLIEGALDYFGQSVREAVTNIVNIAGPPSLVPEGKTDGASTSGIEIPIHVESSLPPERVAETLEAAAASIRKRSNPPSDAPKTLPGVGEERRDA